MTVPAPPWMWVLVEVASSPVSVGALLTPTTLKLPVWLAVSGVTAVAVLPPSFSVSVTARVRLAPAQVGFWLVLL